MPGRKKNNRVLKKIDGAGFYDLRAHRVWNNYFYMYDNIYIGRLNPELSQKIIDINETYDNGKIEGTSEGYRTFNEAQTVYGHEIQSDFSRSDEYDECIKEYKKLVKKVERDLSVDEKEMLPWIKLLSLESEVDNYSDYTYAYSRSMYVARLITVAGCGIHPDCVDVLD